MGFLKNALNKAIKTQGQQHFNAVPNKKHTIQQKQETLAEREKREKQKLADDIRKHAQFEAQGSLKIIQDCVNLVNTTVSPEVFFKRYNLMLDHLETLAGLECTGIFKNSPELPSETYIRVEAQFNAATNDFLDRSFKNAKEHANTLKTDNGKTNAIKRYFDNMEKYIIYMSGESLEYFDKMKAENIIQQRNDEK